MQLGDEKHYMRALVMKHHKMRTWIQTCRWIVIYFKSCDVYECQLFHCSIYTLIFFYNICRDVQQSIFSSR